ncbi:hypothetical protein J113_10070 [Mycobacterium tuberculosis CAS/NITR204]|uniref:Uncharacterized protein n=1 Tax=Mycobacterium tuberculosis CAS/NITR204 TaxID=1310114 RepID=R4MG77_MYCTX|nr:hypothetical protein J113_10070 [Mycobacterium tuberculosis CAS/NITR204]
MSARVAPGCTTCATALSEVSLQPPVPMTEERAQPCRDERRGKPESGTRLERDAVADNRFRVTLGRHGAFVLPLPHAQHRRILAKPPSRLELGDAEPVIVEWQHTEQSQPGTSDRRADRHRVDGHPFRAARHRHRHPGAQLIVDALRGDDPLPHLLGRCGDDALPFNEHRFSVSDHAARWGYVSLASVAA